LELSTALVISTYNRADALDLVLLSVSRQTRPASQIIIVDDGSSDSTRYLVEKWSATIPLIYCWLPDSGFRAARARNLGILKALADYIVFIDGDCIIPPNFIERHTALAESGHFVAGGRYLLDKNQTEQIIGGDLNIAKIAFLFNLKFRYIPLGPFRFLSTSNWKIVRSCNLGVFKHQAISVNGFDESFVGWGREDSDLTRRLLHLGARIKSGRLAVCVLHLWHKAADRDQLSRNEQRFASKGSTHDFEPNKSVLMEL
jgi:glycosyltransferase involved in cell wall biosynthesis